MPWCGLPLLTVARLFSEMPASISKKPKEQIPSCADVFELVDCLTMVLSLLPEGYMLPSMLVCKAFLVAVRNTNRKKEKTSMKYIWNSSRTLQWAIKELRYVMTIKGLARAAENAQLGAMRWALANGCPVGITKSKIDRRFHSQVARRFLKRPDSKLRSLQF